MTLTATPAQTHSMRLSHLIALALLLGLLSGCTYYQTAPGVYTTTPYSTATSKFDQAWSATVNAMLDQGVAISREDRQAGTVRGSRNGIEVTATIDRLASGGVRVQFDTTGATDRDPELIQRISRSYETRMGR